MTHPIGWFLRFFAARLLKAERDAISEFPVIDARTSIWKPRAVIDALPCPTCGHRISAAYFSSHVNWCGQAVGEVLYQKPDDQELEW